jgi:hypothetical protein
VRSGFTILPLHLRNLRHLRIVTDQGRRMVAKPTPAHTKNEPGTPSRSAARRPRLISQDSCSRNSVVANNNQVLMVTRSPFVDMVEQQTEG